MYRSPFVKEEGPFVILFSALELNTSYVKDVSCGIDLTKLQIMVFVSHNGNITHVSQIPRICGAPTACQLTILLTA